MPFECKKYTVMFRILVWLGIALVMFVGAVMLENRSYHLISVLIALMACVPFYLKYEKRKPQAREVVFIAILCACSIVSRILFAPIPGFKPVAAFAMICGMAFGKEAGFINGSLSALISDIFFGQGPWTPFQMIAWGLAGYFAAIMQKRGWFQHRIILYLYGALMGIVFSLIMDVYSVMAMDNTFIWSKYVTIVIASLPFMVIYALSNVIFLYLMEKRMMKKLERVKLKYGILEE